MRVELEQDSLGGWSGFNSALPNYKPRRTNRRNIMKTLVKSLRKKAACIGTAGLDAMKFPEATQHRYAAVTNSPAMPKCSYPCRTHTTARTNCRYPLATRTSAVQAPKEIRTIDSAISNALPAVAQIATLRMPPTGAAGSCNTLQISAVGSGGTGAATGFGGLIQDGVRRVRRGCRFFPV